MAERYSRKFSLAENQYTAGAPVVIAAGALLRDNVTGKMLAQLKFRNIQSQTVKALTVELRLFDTAGLSLGEKVTFEYLDLDAGNGVEFGSKTPIPLPMNNVRRYTVAVTKVVFASDTLWLWDGAPWEPLPKSTFLTDALPELAYQYQLTVGGKTEFLHRTHKDLWLCTCGAWNKEGSACRQCRRSWQTFQAITRQTLEQAQQERLAKEAADAEAARLAAEKAAAEAAVRQKKMLKKAAIAAAVACILYAGFLGVKAVLNSNQYKQAVSLAEAGQYDQAIAAFEKLGDYKDSPEQIQRTQEAKEEARIEAERAAQYQEGQELLAAGKYDEAIAVFEGLGNYKDSPAQLKTATEGKQAARYQKGQELLAAGKYDEAIAVFEGLGNYKDSPAHLNTASDGKYAPQYEAAAALEQEGKTAQAAMAFGRITGYKDARQRSLALWNRTVIDGGNFHTVALKADGTVVAVGENEHGQCDVTGWHDMVSVAAGNGHTVGLRADGTVTAIGYDSDGRTKVGRWKDIIAISTGYWHTVGLKDDGTVEAVGHNEYGQCDVKEWRDIVSISPGGFRTVGLKDDGTVVAVGDNQYGQCDVEEWRDIVSISAGGDHTLGLKADGTVVAVGRNDYGQCYVESWKDIVAIAAGNRHSAGLKADGTVVAVSWNEHGQCDVEDFTDIKMPK